MLRSSGYCHTKLFFHIILLRAAVRNKFYHIIQGRYCNVRIYFRNIQYRLCYLFRIQITPANHVITILNIHMCIRRTFSTIRTFQKRSYGIIILFQCPGRKILNKFHLFRQLTIFIKLHAKIVVNTTAFGIY